MNLQNLIPAVVKSVDRAARTLRFEIPGITDGGEQFPEAEITHDLGDKSEHTEVRVLAGDRVWLTFANGDPNYPIVMRYRAKRTGNEVGWRRWHHDNIETTADAEQKHHAGTVYAVDAGEKLTLTVGATVLTLEDGKATLNAETFTLNGQSATFNVPTATFSGNVVVSGNVVASGNVAASGDVTASGTSLKSHIHPGIRRGGDTSGPPI